MKRELVMEILETIETELDDVQNSRESDIDKKRESKNLKQKRRYWTKKFEEVVI